MIKLEVRNTSAVIANIYAAGTSIVRELKPVVERVSKYVETRTYQRAAVDTGFMREHIRRTLSEKGLAYTVGWRREDFLGAGLAFYPPYVEFGTSRARAQPALMPSAREGEVMIKREVKAAIRRALARRRSRG